MKSPAAARQFRVVVAAFVLVAGALASCSQGDDRGLERRCTDWIAEAVEGLEVDSEQEEVLDNYFIDDPETICSDAARLDLIGSDGRVSAGGLRRVLECQSERRSCYPPILEHNLRVDPRYRTLLANARYVLLVGVLSFADERGLIEPEHEITLDPDAFPPKTRTVYGLAAWSRAAAVPRAVVVRSVRRALERRLLRKATGEERICRLFKKCRGDAYFVDPALLVEPR